MIIESSQHPLVADVGRSFIREKLADNTKKPQQWLEDIRARGSLRDPACGPLLALLKHQGMQPSAAHAKMLEEATAHLLQRIGDVQPDKLRPLLDKVFPFVSVEALRPIVVKVLSILQPKSNLHILAEDDDVFWDLPLSVQQQVWDISVARLHKHCLPLLNSWCMEVDMLHTQVDMLYFVPGAGSQGLLKNTTPSDLRQRSPVIKRLLEMIGSSRQIYKGVVELVRVRWTAAVQDARGAVSMDTDLLTSLRRHLLLALKSKRIDHVDRWDHVSKLVDVLDGCIKAREVSDANCAELKKTCNALMVQQSPTSAGRHVAAARSMTFMPPATERQAAMLARSNGSGSAAAAAAAAAAKPSAAAPATAGGAAAGHGASKRDGAGTKWPRSHSLAAVVAAGSPTSPPALTTEGASDVAAKNLEEEVLMDDLEDAGAIPDDKDEEFALIDDDEEDDEDEFDSGDDAAGKPGPKAAPKPPLKRQKLILDSDDEEEEDENAKAPVATAAHASKAAPDVEAQSKSLKDSTKKSTVASTTGGVKGATGKVAAVSEPEQPAVVSCFGEAEGAPAQSGGDEGGGEDWGLKGGSSQGRGQGFEDEDDWDDGARAGCDDGESIQRSAADFSDTRKLLLDSAAILGEASVQHLLAFEIVRRLYTSVARQHVLPSSDPAVVFLLQLLQLGTAAPAIACGHSDAPRALPPAPPQALNVLLPILAGIIVDGRCAKLEQRPGAGGVPASGTVHMEEDTVQRAASAIANCTVARLLCEAFTLERLGKYESATCMLLLRILKSAEEQRYVSQNGDAAGGGLQGGVDTRWGSGGAWAGAPFEAVRSLTSSPTRPPSSMNSPAATSGLMATQVGDGLGAQRPALYSSQSLLSERCQSGFSSDSIAQERTAFAASLARRLAAVAPGAPPLGAGAGARGGQSGPGTGRPGRGGAGATHASGNSVAAGGGRGQVPGMDGSKAGAKEVLLLRHELQSRRANHYPFFKGVVAHQQVVYALNTVAQVTFECNCARDPTSKAARDAQSAIHAEVGACINLLLTTSKTARSTAAARISQVMESSGKRGVPACTLPWDSQLPDGVCQEYQKVLQRWPGASEHVDDEFREYLQLAPAGPAEQNPDRGQDDECGNHMQAGAS